MTDEKLLELLQILNLDIQEKLKAEQREKYRENKEEKKNYQKEYYRNKDINNIKKFNEFLKKLKKKAG